MKIPNLPTDNLYKFLALFGLVLFVFSSYMLNTTISKTFEFQNDLNLRKDKLEVQSKHKELNASEISKENLEIQKDTKVLNRIVENFPKFYYSYVSFLVLGIILSIIGFVLWYNRTQKINDEILKEQKNRFINDKMIQIHQIQFNKEFKVYNELWPQLILLKDATKELRDVKKDKFDKDLILKEWNLFIDHFTKCNDYFSQNKPFYPIEIFESIDKILEISIEEAKQWVDYLKSENDENNNIENLNIIISEIDNVCIKIRGRIGQLKK